MIQLDYLGVVEDAEEAAGFAVDAVYVERDDDGPDTITVKKSTDAATLGFDMQYDGGRVDMFEMELEEQMRKMKRQWEEHFA